MFFFNEIKLDDFDVVQAFLLEEVHKLPSFSPAHANDDSPRSRRSVHLPMSLFGGVVTSPCSELSDYEAPRACYTGGECIALPN